MTRLAALCALLAVASTSSVASDLVARFQISRETQVCFLALEAIARSKASVSYELRGQKTVSWVATHTSTDSLDPFSKFFSASLGPSAQKSEEKTETEVPKLGDEKNFYRIHLHRSGDRVYVEFDSARDVSKKLTDLEAAGIDTALLDLAPVIKTNQKIEAVFQEGTWDDLIAGKEVRVELSPQQIFDASEPQQEWGLKILKAALGQISPQYEKQGFEIRPHERAKFNVHEPAIMTITKDEIRVQGPSHGLQIGFDMVFPNFIKEYGLSLKEGDDGSVTSIAHSLVELEERYAEKIKDLKSSTTHSPEMIKHFHEGVDRARRLKVASAFITLAGVPWQVPRGDWGNEEGQRTLEDVRNSLPIFAKAHQLAVQNGTKTSEDGSNIETGLAKLPRYAKEVHDFIFDSEFGEKKNKPEEE